MDMQKIIQMNHGDGELSYAHNSFTIPGKLFIHKIKPAVENAIKYHLLSDITKIYKFLNVADLGCGVGPTPVTLIETVTETVHNVYKETKSANDDQMPDIQMYMSDLPSNDFNMLIKNATKLLEEKRDGMPLCFVMGAPGSFYGRLFPAKSLHFVHSNSALHWLSQVPRGIGEGGTMNKDNVLGSETSAEDDVVQSYFAQFKNDFTSFLNCRSQEVVTNAYMLLSFPGRKSTAPWQPFQHIWFTQIQQALACLVSKGVVNQEKVDSFNIPIYFPCKEEVERIISEEGSFSIENIEVTIQTPAIDIKDTQLRADALTKFLRATMEAIFSHHFGPQVWDVLQNQLSQIIFEHLILYNDPYDLPFFIILLKKKLD